MATMKPYPLETPRGMEKLDKRLLHHLQEAAKAIDRLFLKQAYEHNEKLLREIEVKGDRELIDKFWLHYGPFDRTEHDKAFIKGHEKPTGANFYPADLTKEEFNEWLREHSEEKEAFTNPYTVIRRRGNKLIATAYHVEWAIDSNEVAHQLREAAKHTNNNSLQQFLEARAQAFLNDDYYESELLWMDIDSDVDVTIGPYEVYEDRLNGIKTAYEACIGIVDHEATHELQQFERQALLLEEKLPLAHKHQRQQRGTQSPIRIINLLVSAGDCRAGIHFTAFNLPNDERVREVKGSKKVMLKNIAQAKFETCWQPITKRILDEETIKKCTFDAYFKHILLHEISHGIGPGFITKTGKKTTVSNELKEKYSFIEEAKADVIGVHNAFILAEQGVIGNDLAENILITYIAGIFRSIRFGINEAHGGANMLAYNWLEERGAVHIHNNKLLINQPKSKEALEALAKQLLIIEAEGDYEGAKELLQKYNKMPPHIKGVLDSMSDIPIDITPLFPGEQP